MTVTIHHGNNLEILPRLPDCSVDSIVTDPPYELGFMGKKWDASGIAYNVTLWTECLRVLKPGGHLLAFGGTRTYHRMAVAIEDAGFEIRDSIHWIYGSGFPKSLDVSKAIDKAAGAEREVIGVGTSGKILRANGQNERPYQDGKNRIEHEITAPATDAAKQWEGWGTALKPAHEPIVVARKPFTGTVAQNVLTYGTGALNIDGCRVETSEVISNHARSTDAAVSKGKYGDSREQETHQTPGQALGRWPANIVHDGHPDVVDRFPSSNSDDGSAARFFAATPYGDVDEASFLYCAKAGKAERNAGLDQLDEVQTTGGGGLTAELRPDGSYETASAAGKYGSVKAKQQNHHPTVKPIALMRWLVRLVTPPDGVVLDPFAGSGTTLVAAILEKKSAIGIELTADYLPIITGRTEWAKQHPPTLI